MKVKHIRLLLVDDHEIVREGLRSCLAPYRQLQVVGEAASGEQALVMAAQTKPDVVLMDINLPHMSGLEATRHLQQQLPGSKILILTVYDNPEYVREVMRAGAKGYVLKNTAPQDLVAAIEKIHRNEVHFSPAVVKSVMYDYLELKAEQQAGKGPRLSKRESEILALIAEGHSNKAIASQLRVGVRTVESHREHIMNKLNLHSVAALTKFAISRGLIKLI
jgi:two-component system response regulator NreC